MNCFTIFIHKINHKRHDIIVDSDDDSFDHRQWRHSTSFFLQFQCSFCTKDFSRISCERTFNCSCSVEFRASWKFSGVSDISFWSEIIFSYGRFPPDWSPAAGPGCSRFKPSFGEILMTWTKQKITRRNKTPPMAILDKNFFSGLSCCLVSGLNLTFRLCF